MSDKDDSETVIVKTVYQLKLEAIQSALPSITIENLDNNLFLDGGPYLKNVIEICGEGYCGKSFLLYEIMAKLLLPLENNGKCGNVIFLNCDQKFSHIIFTKILEKLVSTSSSSLSSEVPSTSAADANESIKLHTDNIKLIIDDCFKRLRIYNCHTPDDYKLAMYSVKNFLTQQRLNIKNPILIAIDSLCAYYWLECKDPLIRMQTYYERNVQKIKDLCEHYNICGIYVRPSYLTKNITQTSFNFAKETLIIPSTSKSLEEKCLDETDNPIINYRFKLEFLSSSSKLLDGHKNVIQITLTTVNKKEFNILMVICDNGLYFL